MAKSPAKARQTAPSVERGHMVCPSNVSPEEEEEKHPVALSASLQILLLKYVHNVFCVNLVKKTHTNEHSPAPSVTRCQEQNPLAFIKIQIGGIEAWVTSGGVFSYCTLACSSAAPALSVCWVEREVVVVINKEETGLNGTRR